MINVGGKMYKVVIIDDEEIIVQGLTKMLPWDRWNCRVVGSADNGIEGIGLIKKVRPHIVITDICMPQMDGLAMIAAIRNECPKLQIMILTGYSEFEYAREALRLGVTRLLVKPSKMDELIEAMEAMTAKLNEYGITPDSPMPVIREGIVDEDGVALDGDETDTDDGVSDNVRSFIVRNALEYMRENYAQKLRLEDVADHVYVSQWHLSKLMNRHTGKNFSELMNEVRVEKAKELLADPGYRIGDIAEQVGFLDMAHFSRVFKKITGSSPSDYRNS